MPAHRTPARAPFALLLAAALLGGCGGAGGGGSARPAPAAGRASEAEWAALAAARPEPLAGAARVAVGEVRILGTPAWSATPVDLGLGMSELVAAGLLRRRDVQYVERRRFAAAVEAERRGAPRPEGAPSAGISPGAQYVLSATWASVGLDSAFVDLRLADAQSGAVAASWRGATAAQADPVAVARRVVAGTLAALERLGAHPAWQDPEANAAPAAYRASDVGAAAVSAFFRGLAAEETWDWEGARAGYQAALAAAGPSFVEAAAALARAARLRNGGTLGPS